MNETEVDVQSIEHLEFDVPCVRKNSAGIPDCDLPARWAGTVKCCGRVLFICDLHLRGGTSPTGHVVCQTCKTRHIDDRTRFSFVRPL